MKYCVLIMDGASGYPIPGRGKKTSLELASTPNLNELAKKGVLGLVANVPDRMEPSSAVACMSVMGYDPRKYYSGRGPIEARAMGLELAEGDAAFRCNLVSIKDGKMESYSSGHISDAEARELIAALNGKLGGTDIAFYPGVSYRHILVLKNKQATLKARCTPPHDIPGQPIIKHIPMGDGSRILNDLMIKSEDVLRDHPVNRQRAAEGKIPATSIWLFWGGEKTPDLPPFNKIYGKKAAMSSGVDLLRGIATMAGMDILSIRGVTGGLDNDYQAQIDHSLEALKDRDIVFIHVESPDEAGHGGQIDEKIKAIEEIDRIMVKRLAGYKEHPLRVLILPDHPTPIQTQTHAPEPVPFILWGPGIESNNSLAFSEANAEAAGNFISQGHTLLGKLLHM